MLKTKITAFTTVALVAFGLSSHVAADEIGSGWYLGADLGHAELQLEDRGNISNMDLSHSAFAIHGGYRFSRYISVESTYADLGDDSFRVTPTAGYIGIPLGAYDVGISGKRLDLTLVASIPLGERYEVYAKAGLAHTETGYEAHVLNNPGRFSEISSDEFYGAGLRLHFDAPWSLRLQWDRTQLSYSLPDVDTWWLGSEYRFGSR